MAHRSERVLVTGADGFTGRPLVRALREDGHEVITLGLHAGACELAADLLKPLEIVQAIEQARPTAIVHLAGVAATTGDDLHDLYAINVAGTATLLRAALAVRAGISTIVLASSAKVYGSSASLAPLDEDTPPLPTDHYGVSKLAMEHAARLFANVLPITVVRPFNYTGPGQDPRNFLVPKLVRAFVRREALTVGNLNVARDFSDVATVIEAYRRLIASPQPGKTFNVCSGTPVRLTDLVSLIQEVTGNRIEISVDPALVRAGEADTIIGSPARLEAAVGALPRVCLRTTLRNMAAADVA